jgi:acyl-CoA dehydrogenase
MAADVIDHAMQASGAKGVAKELPLQLMGRKARTMRFCEAPPEVYRMAIMRRTVGR